MPRKKISPPPKEELQNLYAKEGTSISSLARHYGTTNPTVRNWLISYDIPRKDHKQASTEANNRHRNSVKPSKETLQKLYLTENQFDLSRMFCVTQSTLRQWLIDYEIEINHSDACKRGKDRQHADIRFSKEQIIQAYDRTKPMIFLANELGISISYLKTLFKEYDIIAEKPWRSQAEIDLYEYLIKTYPNLKFEHSNKTIIFPLELDIVCHEKKIAIEYCGLYWHSENSGEKSRNYHTKKYRMCKEKGYKLITIFETDPENKVKKLLSTYFNSNTRIFARKTTVKEISSKENSDFNKMHHMHDNAGSSYRYGLFYENELVMTISFTKSRYNKKYEYECSRMTSHSEYTIVGGASKLFKYFIEKVCPLSIVTYSDLRFGEGNVYVNCGFVRMKDSGENYWYFKPNENILYSRVKFQKHKLKSLLENYDDTLTEWDNMLMNGWDRIWDCGNAVYVWEKK